MGLLITPDLYDWGMFQYMLRYHLAGSGARYILLELAYDAFTAAGSRNIQ